MNKKDRIKFSIRIIFFVICIIGFICQVLQLIQQYMSGQTIVNIDVELIKYNKLPSITICYPEFVSMQKMAKLYPELKTAYEEYLNLINNVNDIDIKNETLLKTLNDIYWSNFTAIGKQYEIPFYDLFEKISIPFRFPKRPIYQFEKYMPLRSRLNELKKTEYSIEIKAKGTILNNSDIEYVEISDFSPIESISMDFRVEGKCYTFFSELNLKWTHFNIDLEYIRIVINHDKNWFPPNVYDRNPLKFIIHSSNTIPKFSIFDSFSKLISGYSHTITYSITKTILLPPNYSTNCRNYAFNAKGYEKLRTDCISKCIDKQLHKRCTQKACIFPVLDLLRREMFSEYKSLKYCSMFDNNNSYGELNECIRKYILIVNSICDDNCPKECNQQFYDFVVTPELPKLPLSPWDKRTFVFIRHNRLPDQIIEHLPEMTFITFISNFGGLAGIWLGLSALAILKFITHYI